MKIISIVVAGLLAISVNAKGLETQHSHAAVVDSNNSGKIQPRYQGVILEVLNANGYTYLKIDEKTPGFNPKKLKSFWIVVNRTSAKVGDYVRFTKELVTKNYKSKALDKTFDELMFASNLEYRVSK